MKKSPRILIIEEHKTRAKLVGQTIISEFGMFSSLPVEVKVGGATIFVLNVEQFLKL